MSSAATLEESVERIVRQVVDEMEPLHGLVPSSPRYSTLDLILVLMSEHARELLVKRLGEVLKETVSVAPPPPGAADEPR